MRHAPRPSSASSLPSQNSSSRRSGSSLRSSRIKAPEKKRTADGKIILEPQPDESINDPLNWSKPRRDAALGSLGLYCLVGGGMTPILAAGFTNVSETYHVTIPQVALTTGLYMMGLGVGSVVMSPTAIKLGKRPVYIMTALTFLLSAVWCALSPSYISLLVARVFQGIAISPTECLPSASIAEIFFLHERAYRLGIYTLLLLGGKNLMPLISAAIIQSLGWRWVFWIVAIVVGFCGVLLFLFVPETFWDRTPHRNQRRDCQPKRPTPLDRHSSTFTRHTLNRTCSQSEKPEALCDEPARPQSDLPNLALDNEANIRGRPRICKTRFDLGETDHTTIALAKQEDNAGDKDMPGIIAQRSSLDRPTIETAINQNDFTEVDLRDARSPPASSSHLTNANIHSVATPRGEDPISRACGHDVEKQRAPSAEDPVSSDPYTAYYQRAPPKTFLATLKPYDGRLSPDAWWRIAIRPFLLFAYPAILWSATVYALSVGWLIVLSESVANIYRSSATYNFSALQAGLIYISPFVGGVLGTAVAGKLSDYVVRFMSRQNGGLYEPEFRLVMAIPVALATTIGLMGYGWSAQEKDRWIVPTVFFGIISFGCSLGSTTAITFAVDSYRVYAGEALVTLNFSKNIFHGLVFSLFFTDWLESDGAKEVFLALGGIQLFFLLWTIPMYIFGKRCRMWTARRNFLEKF